MTSGVVKVVRDGPRGWHYIDASRFDPAVHTLYDAAPTQPAPQFDSAPLPAVDAAPVEPAPKRRGRPPKVRP